MQISTRQLTFGAAGVAAALAFNLPAAGCASMDQDEALLTAEFGQRDFEKTGNDREAKDQPRPFDASRSANLDVNAALVSAAINGNRVLLVLGGNWCHDSRALAANLETGELSKLIEENYELVYVDVGHRDRNLDVAIRFGAGALNGTPTILILSPQGALLNADTAHGWRNADSRSLTETEAYFRSFITQ